MYELTQVGEKTYYINCPAKMGIYLIDGGEVCLIDSGNDKDAGKKVLKILEANNWTLKTIINTHSHADHIGGNNLLQQRTGCGVYSVGTELAFINDPVLEPSFLYGGYPCKELRNKFLLAQTSEAWELTEDVLPQGMEMLRLDGHSFAMAALKTSDEVWFLADCLTSETIIEKYHISFLYDVGAYINSLKAVNALSGKLFIPAHGEPTENIQPLVKLNKDKVNEIVKILKQLCVEPMSFDDLLKGIFDRYSLTMDFNQNVLIGSTIRSYLAYLHDQGDMDVIFSQNKLLWHTACQ